MHPIQRLGRGPADLANSTASDVCTRCFVSEAAAAQKPFELIGYLDVLCVYLLVQQIRFSYAGPRGKRMRPPAQGSQGAIFNCKAIMELGFEVRAACGPGSQGGGSVNVLPGNLKRNVLLRPCECGLTSWNCQIATKRRLLEKSLSMRTDSDFGPIHSAPCPRAGATKGPRDGRAAVSCFPSPPLLSSLTAADSLGAATEASDTFAKAEFTRSLSHQTHFKRLGWLALAES